MTREQYLERRVKALEEGVDAVRILAQALPEEARMRRPIVFLCEQMLWTSPQTLEQDIARAAADFAEFVRQLPRLEEVLKRASDETKASVHYARRIE